MGLQNLSDANFYVEGGKLKCNVPGVILILFKIKNCKICQGQAIPLINTIAQQDQRLNFGICSVDLYRNVIGMSKATNMPIKSVPTFLFYVNNNPIMKYPGKRTLPELSNFISAMLNKLRSQQTPPQQPNYGQTPNQFGGPPQQYGQPQQPMPTYQKPSNPQSSLNPQDKQIEIPKNVVPYNEPYKIYKNFN